MPIPSDKPKGKHFIARLCLLVLSVWVSLPAPAQDNPYKIDNALYPIYQQASKMARQPKGLPIADSLYRKALELGDKKAQCLAFTIPLQYYVSQKDEAKMEEASARLKEISRANDYLQYYYYAWSMEITYYLNHQRSLFALQNAEKMKEQAFKDQFPYGILSCIRSLGHIYKSRGEHEMSARYYQEALDYMLENMPDQDPSQLYVLMSEHYRSVMKDYDTALEYCEKALKSSRTERAATLAMIEKCLSLFDKGRMDEFGKCYEKAMRMADSCKMSNTSLTQARLYKCIQDKQYEKAHAYADQFEFQELQMHAYIYEQAKDYPNAIRCLRGYRQARDSLNHHIQESDIAELSVQIGNERLKLEKLQAASHYRFNLSCTVIGFMLLLILLLILYIRRKRKANRRLSRMNEELVKARDMAESANKTKTLFLQNMSHEIRTPLNSIVGFSQILTTPGMDFAPEELQDFSRLIQHNSDLLLTLVNDVLSVAELESSNYSMNMERHACNELCSEAIATVTHRNPEGVKLYYTSDTDDGYQILTDGHRVRQVLINFLTNAEKHTTQGEIHLHCSLAENPGHVTFSVTDTGTGIPPEFAKKLFKRFEKADNFEQGTGLGLSICRLIAERLHGEVHLDSEYTGGARFVFTLPIRRSAEEER